MGKNINEILTSAMCSETLFANDFVAFAHERAALLVEKARSLCGIKIITSDTAIPI